MTCLVLFPACRGTVAPALSPVGLVGSLLRCKLHLLDTSAPPPDKEPEKPAGGSAEAAKAQSPPAGITILLAGLQNPENATKLVKGVADAVADAFLRYETAERSHERRLAYLVGSLLALIVASGAILTALRVLDPTAFAFMVGPIIGGLITYLVESLPPDRPGPF